MTSERPAGAAPRRARVDPFKLYGEPALIVVAAISVFVAFAVNNRPAASNAADFYVFWDSGRWLREGADVYLGHPLRPSAGYNLNPPTLSLLFVPFSFLPLLPAFLLWTTLAVGGFVVSGFLIAAQVLPRRGVLVAAVILCSQATFAALQLGQLSWLLTILVTLAWRADRSGAPWRSGLLLGGLIAAKPFLGLFGLYALWRRSARLVWGMVVGAAAFWLAGLAIGGLGAYWSWLFVLRRVSWTAHLANGSLLGAITRAFEQQTARELAIAPLVNWPALVTPVWLVAGLALVGIGARRMTIRPADIDRHWLIVLLLSLLLSPLGWSYYVPLLAGPAVAIFLSGMRTTRMLLVAGYVCFLVPYSMVLRDLGPVGTLLLGSVYTWGLLAWFSAAAGAPARSGWTTVGSPEPGQALESSGSHR